MKKWLFFLALTCAPSVYAQNNGALLPALPQQFLNSNGAPLANGRLCTQVSGTNTPLAVYSDPALTLPLPNPIHLNAAGIATTSGGTQTAVYTQPLSYRVTAYAAGSAGGNLCNGTAVGTLVWQFDGVYDFAQVSGGGGGGGGGSGNNQSCKSGTLLSDKINAAYALVPNTGGIIDCTNLTGAQTLGSDPFTGMTKSVTVIMPIGTSTSTVALNVPSNVTMLFPNGAILSNTNTTTISGYIAASSTKIFTNPVNINSPLLGVLPQWFGALGNGTNDDTVPIQQAIDSCRGPFQTGVGYAASCHVILPVGTYKTTATLNMYSNVPNGGYLGASVSGITAFETIISYQGPTTTSAIRMVGTSQKLTDIHILDNGTGWLDGIQYDGDASIGISTQSHIDRVVVECQGHPGNGVSAGRSAHQADQMAMDRPFITGCLSGSGFITLDPNAVDFTLVNPTISFCWIGVNGGNNTAIQLFGGEISNNDLNFLGFGGGALTSVGTRSETSKKQFSQGVGGTPGAITFTGYLLGATFWSSNTGQPRPATNGTGNTGAPNTLVLSVANSVTFGDFITVAGAGPAGALLHTHISTMSDPTHATLDTNPIATNVTNAAVNLDTTVEQNQFNVQGGGPFVMTSSLLLSSQAENAFPASNGKISLVGVGFAENFTFPNPLNIAPNSGAWASRVSWEGIWYNNNASTFMPDHKNLAGTPTLFFSTNNVGGAANNAWVLNGTEPAVNGIQLIVTVSTFSLQAGVNTLNYNGDGAKSILGALSNANLASGVSTGAQVTLQYDGTHWRLLGQ